MSDHFFCIEKPVFIYARCTFEKNHIDSVSQIKYQFLPLLLDKMMTTEGFA